MSNPYVQAMANGFAEEMKKIAAEGVGGGVLKVLTHPATLGAGAGIAAYKLLSDAERDRRMGRQLRIQNPGM